MPPTPYQKIVLKFLILIVKGLWEHDEQSVLGRNRIKLENEARKLIEEG